MSAAGTWSALGFVAVMACVLITIYIVTNRGNKP